MKKILSIIFAVLLFASPAFASQNATVLPTTSPYAGLTMLNNINSAFDTFQSNFSGATAPASPISYQWWADTTESLLKFYDGSDWLPVAKFSGTEWVPISNGIINTIPASTGSANAYILTYSPVPTELVTGQHYPFISNFQNTGAATLNVNSLGAKAITKQGAVALASGDISSGAVIDTVYDGTQFQMLSQLGNAASGTVTAIATNNGITGGTITTSGTIGLAAQSNGTVLSNISGSSAAPTGNSVSSVMDSAVGSTQGSLAYRGASAWQALTPGTNGQVLTTQGSGANPVWASIASPSIAQRNVYTSSGTWTKPTVTSSSITRVQCWGAGGGAGNQNTYYGGGGGYQDITKLTSSLSATVTVTVGAGGCNTGAGGNTTFGSYVTAYGGTGGTSGNGGNAFANGGGQLNNLWDGGGSSGSKNSVFGGGAGLTGISIYGGDGGAVCTNGAQPGGGAGGCAGSSRCGGDGQCIVTTWY